MPSEIRKIGKHTLVYGAGVVASKMVSFIMLPVYTRFLTTADYGVLELLGTTIDVIGMIGGIGLAAGVFKHYAEASGKAERGELISTATLGSSGLSFLIAAAGLALSPLLTRMLFGNAISPLYFRLFFLIYFFQNIGNLSLMFVQAEER
jgi:O-antigen/teichoic acid export membrane protein